MTSGASSLWQGDAHEGWNARGEFGWMADDGHGVGENWGSGALSPALSGELTLRTSWSTDARDLVGTWRVDSWTEYDLATGVVDDPLGTPAPGVVTFVESGQVTLTAASSDRVGPRSPMHVTDQEADYLFHTFVALAGRYRHVSPGTLEVGILLAWNEAWTGASLPVHFTVERQPAPGRDRLTLGFGPQPGVASDMAFTTILLSRMRRGDLLTERADDPGQSPTPRKEVP